MPENFRYEQDGPLATITFTRPERRNCMTREVLLDFEKLIHRVRDGSGVRVLIVTGEGTAFSAGADISGGKGISDPKERLRIFAERNKGSARIVGRVCDTVLRLDALTIGAVNGYAVGGGWALAASMDFVVAAETAEFWLPEVELKAPFSGVPAELIARRVGPWRAKEIMILCRHYMARDLLAMGMVNQVVKPADLMNATHELAQALLKMPYDAATKTKHAIDNVTLGPRLY
jgi:enoyl-CoA hydratase/3-hydroxypropionyl-coenzyme A dehydratase